jgi:hypothetical protein
MTNRIIRIDRDIEQKIPSTPLIRTEKTLNTIIDSIRRDFQWVVWNKANPISNIGVATNKKFVDILKLARSTNDPILVKAFLCPLYDEKWGISGDFESFSDIPMRAQKKFQSYAIIFSILKKYLLLRPTFLLADRWVSITDPGYDMTGFARDIGSMRQIFAKAIERQIDPEWTIQTFTEVWVPITQISRDEPPTQDMIDGLFQSYGIDFAQFRNQYAILTQSFGAGWAYGICRDYLAESAYVARTEENSIYLNVEACSPMNTLYQIWVPGKRLVDTNLYIGASYRP